MDLNHYNNILIIIMATITLYIGCMYSGKTSELIRECRRCLNINKNILAINFADDNRYFTDNYIASHNLEKISCIKVNKLSEINENTINNIDYIFIDEGQFFTDLKEYVVKWCEKYNKHVIVIGLSGDFMRLPFGQILDLIPLADKVVKLNALCSFCKDGTEALFTHRLSSESEQVIIGSNNYSPVCRKHYIELNNI